jgi:hypothetical protein
MNLNSNTQHNELREITVGNILGDNNEGSPMNDPPRTANKS